MEDMLRCWFSSAVKPFNRRDLGGGGGGDRRARQKVGGAIVIMSLRALGSLLSRRLSPRGIPHARVRAQAETLGVATRDPPLRSLNTLRDLDVVGGSIGALAAAGGVAALIGILCSNGDESSLVVTGKEIKNVKTEELEGMSVDELAMKARFEEWMKQFRRTYQNEEEKTMRYEVFKANAIWCDNANAQSKSKASTPWELNDLADWTFKEMYGSGRKVDYSFWEEYLNEGYPTVHASEWYKKKKAKKAELDAATKAEQVGATMKKKGGC